MNAKPTKVRRCWSRLLAGMLVLFLCGCATSKVDWNSRVGVYTYDQAVIDFGPPDKQAKLHDGTTVAEWLTRRSYTYTSFGVGYGYPYWYPGPFYPGYVDTTPNYYLRLIFGPDDKLKGWKKFAK